MINLTEQEKTFLKEIKESMEYYSEDSNETCEDGKELCENSVLGSKKARAILSNLMQKGIVNYYGNLPCNKHCWNAISKGANYEEAIKEAR